MSDTNDSLERMAKMMREQAAEIQYQGLDIRKDDGRILVRSNFTSEQEKAWRAEAITRLATLPSSMEELAEEIDGEILQFDPLDVIAHIAWINTLHDAENWDEHQFEGNDAYTEYTSLLCLTHQIGDFKQESLLDSYKLDAVSIQGRVKRLFQMSMLQDQLEPLNSESPPSTEEELRFLTLMHEVGVRYPGSTEHLHEVLRDLFSPVSKRMTNTLGFSIEDALALDAGIFNLINEKLAQKLSRAFAFEKRLRKAVKRYRQRRRLDEHIKEEQLAQLAKLKPSESAKHARDIALAWAFFGFGQTMAFSAKDLAEAADVGEDEVEAFLGFLSLEFGSVDEFFRLPRPTHPLQKRPIIRFTDGSGSKYLCPVLQAVAWSIRPRIEEWLHEAPSSSDESVVLKEDYLARRSEYCEKKAFELLTAVLKPTEGHAHIGTKYLHSVDGAMSEFEIDGIFLLDSVLVLLEVKSGGVRPSARRGGLRSMRSDLESLVGYASDQTKDAWEYLSTADNPVLELIDGKHWSVPMDKVRRVFRICVTLEDLAVFATNIHNLESIGMVDLETPFWAVSIYDLLVIRDLIDAPAVFVHYLSNRYAIEKTGRVHGYCELDHLGCYLMGQMPSSRGLPNELPEDARIMLDPTYSSLIDNWYFYLAGDRKAKPKKPERDIPPAFRSVLDSLQANRPPRYLEMSCLLLDLPDVAQAALADALRNLDAQTNKDKMRHDVSVIPPGWDMGVTVLTSHEDTAASLGERLEAYCMAKKHQLRKDCWIGIGSISWADEPIQLTLVLDEPWKADPDLDNLVRTLLPASDP